MQRYLNLQRICLDNSLLILFFFFFNDPATTEIYTLSLHDALPIWTHLAWLNTGGVQGYNPACHAPAIDRKSTRLNSSHVEISYAVFCLKKKKKIIYVQIKKKLTDFSNSITNRYCVSITCCQT